MQTAPLIPAEHVRTAALIGEEGLFALQNASVAVFGVGGVGGHLAEALARAGVGRIHLIDRDTVSLSNINRQAVALHSTVGRPKVEVLAERFRDINPDVKLHALPMYLTEELKIENSKLKINRENRHSVQDDTGEDVGNSQFSILNSQFDYIVDAIDTIAPKCALIAEALRRGIPIVSSMGAGAKSDITQIRFADIWDTYHCGLAKAVRTRLKKEGLRRPLPVVFSTEQADRNAVITIEGEQNKKSTTGTISYMPAVFGCYLAEYVIRKLSGKMKDESCG